MRRRTLLQFAALTATAPAQPPSFKLSVRVEALFPQLSLPQQIEKVAQAGYQGFEFGNWRAADANEVTRLKDKLGLECVCIVGNRGVNPEGMGLCDPAEREAFLSEIRASLDAAHRFGTTRLVVLSGNRVPGIPRPQQHASIVEGLKRAQDIAAPRGVTLLIEVVNTLARVEPLHPQENHLDYYLDHAREAFQIVDEVSSPFVKILFDIYHVQIMEGNLIDTILRNIRRIGHFHVGDVPGRHEPGTGEINYQNVFKAIRESGFPDYVAMEYVPFRDAMATLAEVRRIV
jgi:hydroxypyruvate isomerase